MKTVKRNLYLYAEKATIPTAVDKRCRKTALFS